MYTHWTDRVQAKAQVDVLHYFFSSTWGICIYGDVTFILFLCDNERLLHKPANELQV